MNDAPIIMVIDDQVLQEDSVGVFTFEVSDIDTGTVLTLTAFSDTALYRSLQTQRTIRLRLHQTRTGTDRQRSRLLYQIIF